MHTCIMMLFEEQSYFSFVWKQNCDLYFSISIYLSLNIMMILLCLTSFPLLLFPLCVNQVIVRDIVSKNVIAQFRAHKSPISALCFDPSGILLVTASVQGHNINIFKIIPGILGTSSACDAGSSYVHLYRLQRGLTNAVRALLLFHSFLLQL